MTEPTLRERLLIIAHHPAREAKEVVDRASSYEAWILEGEADKQTARPILTVAKTTPADAGPKR